MRRIPGTILAVLLLLSASLAWAGPEADEYDRQLARAVDRYLDESHGRLRELSAGSLDLYLLALADEPAAEKPAGEEVDITKKDETGTDPRGFGNKFMPYTWWGQMENDLEVIFTSVFGMVPFSERVALTYDWPLAKRVDYSDVAAFQAMAPGGELPPTELPSLGGGQIPLDDLDPDGDVAGMGDLVLRVFYMPKSMDRKFEIGMGPKKGQQGNINHLFGIEVTLPTASEDVLGGDLFIVSPLYTLVIDTPFFGFFAMMNFFDFDVFGEDERGHVLRYRGRWFLMQPLSKPGPGFFDGWYLMPEFQPIYDFENEEFSLWMGPEIGKIIKPGLIVYFKPGFGIGNDAGGERDLTAEFGVRLFY